MTEPLYTMRKKGENDILIYSDRVEVAHARLDGSNVVFLLAELIPEAQTPDGLMASLARRRFTLVQAQDIAPTAEQMSHEETPRTTAYAAHTLVRIPNADYERLNRLRHRYMREQGRPKMGMAEVITALLDKEAGQ